MSQSINSRTSTNSPRSSDSSVVFRRPDLVRTRAVQLGYRSHDIFDSDAESEPAEGDWIDEEEIRSVDSRQSDLSFVTNGSQQSGIEIDHSQLSLGSRRSRPSSIVSTGHQSNSNNRRNTSKRGYCITINNYSQIQVDLMHQLFAHGIKSNNGKRVCPTYVVFQLEIAPTTNTPHIQGYIHFKNAVDFATIINYLKPTPACAHPRVVQANGNASANRTYCTKESSRDPAENSGPYEYGILPADNGQSLQLRDAYQQLREGAPLAEVVHNYPMEFIRYTSGISRIAGFYSRPRTTKTNVHWFWGPAGSGKTSEALRLGLELLGDTSGLPTSLQSPFFKDPRTKWFDNYSGQPVVIIDDFRSDSFHFDHLLRLFDRFPLQVESKGSSCYFNAKTIIITTPYHPCHENMYGTLPEEDQIQLIRRIVDGGSIKEFTYAEEIPEDVQLAMEEINKFRNSRVTAIASSFIQN